MSKPEINVSMGTIAAYWADHADEWGGALRSRHIGWAEPFCFACGWLAPVDDWMAGPPGLERLWKLGAAWLDRAHLMDRALGGPDEPANLVPLCHLCHDAMPSCPTRDEAMAWVRARPIRGELWQMWTDIRLRGRSDVSRTTTLLRARCEYLEARVMVLEGASTEQVVTTLFPY